MHKNTIYLQIKTGILGPFGIALKEQMWQSPPNDFEHNRVEMNYYNRKMEMVDLTLDDNYALTGNIFNYLNLNKYIK